MFIGHFAVGFAAKKAVPRVSLGSLFLASQFIDLLWPILLLIGWETVAIHPGDTAFTPLEFVHYPITHSLLSVAGWGLLVGGVYWLRRRDVRVALLLGACTISHWILDFITHRPDLPLAPGDSARVGLGLWNSIAGTVALEGGLFIAGVAVYARITRARDKIGQWALWGFVSFLIVVYISNMLSAPPPSPRAIGYVGLAQWLLILMGYWIDKHRIGRPVQ